MTKAPLETLRIGFIGSGFIARFHLQAMTAVRNCQVTGIYSTTPSKREATAALANDLSLGPCRAYDSIEHMLCSGVIDAVWILSTNDTRLEAMREIHRLVTREGVALAGVACEKPLGRTLPEAREMLELVQGAGLYHGYLENQLFAGATRRGKEIVWRRAVPLTGRPYLARATEEHSGPHEPWFWQGERQGGGVLLDMMCHSVEVARFLLTGPDETRDSLRLKSANATVATLKWGRAGYAEKLRQSTDGAVDFAQRPVEDFARGILVYEDLQGDEVIVEVTTSWAYVGPGLRISLELLGPEYTMSFDSLATGLKVFLSRNVAGASGEDLVEKQNAEQGLMPVLEDEVGTYGYAEENRHMVEAFRKGETPMETFDDGVAVIAALMALYLSAESSRTVDVASEDLSGFVPAVARQG
ncbi:MAG: Gfo/Idh/MocA family oxidoreductase [Rhodospirillaceae bacterium]|nr:Gfo/Idh/MocA family oxidoreductase [Rhodospirillaceae bacterium]MBT6206064.1 Gfo/Idh/MocA family oxidoreductase [Rhodospirillaceae bacterium]MBT6511536.1 Gfo/Idh/MocA family oxidoreductase [Rhodospirillaceae bacterium]MBT7612422.1 Gfo/Idh/MocA family oxidoreductase [Rhodospirillaceae bacterium]MBT7649219.1 Gfo/Idh/MocA family oxidoreductase [Rhodospirillaceae bacterium]